tara:strand:+ start:1577 stop:1996 length:420 start_codon:yes stop_codon:yes gene_type:complete
MHHLAILSEKLNLLHKILSGEKTIESRWYKFKKTPYKNITVGDTIYLKESGELTKAKAEVKETLFFDNLNEEKMKEILEIYGKQLCVDVSYLEKVKDKRYCTLIFLDNIENVEPFAINKSGYGNMAAWITVNDISEIKL